MPSVDPDTIARLLKFNVYSASILNFSVLLGEDFDCSSNSW